MANGGIIGPVKCISTPVTKVTSFTASGTFNAYNCTSTAPEILVVAGGGSGGGGEGTGGGGAGGFRISNSTCMPSPQTSPLATPTALPVSVQGYTIEIGGGGPGGEDTIASSGRFSCALSKATS